MRDVAPATPTCSLPVAIIVALSIVPFLFNAIPPLTDVPGHIGQFSVQTAPAGSVLLRYFSFHWAPTLNLAADLIVQAATPLLGVVPTVRLLCMATTALTVLAIAVLARFGNRAGGYAYPWALLFVFNSSFLWGFLNFELTQALAILCVAGWIGLAERPQVRAAATLIATPLLLVGHGVAGIAAVAMIVGYEAWPTVWRDGAGKFRHFLTTAWPPVVAAATTILLWKMVSHGQGGQTLWLPIRKVVAVIHALQDQNKVFDIATVVAATIVAALGWVWGARLRGGQAGVVGAVAILFIASPSLLSGSDEVDTRLAPLVAMVFFSLQDWSTVADRRRKVVVALGFALLAARFGTTLVSFVEYSRDYDGQLVALRYVRPGSRVMNFTLARCESWRSRRLEHLGNLATTYRNAWVNAHWSIKGIHLLQVRYRPATLYFDDPSQMVFSPQCVDHQVKTIADYRPAQTVSEAVRAAPLDRVDYLWIIGTRLPPAFPDNRLKLIWTNRDGELYKVKSVLSLDAHLRSPAAAVRNRVRAAAVI